MKLLTESLLVNKIVLAVFSLGILSVQSETAHLDKYKRHVSIFLSTAKEAHHDAEIDTQDRHGDRGSQ